MVHTVQNPTGPNRTLQDHTGPHQINRDYEKNIKDHIGLYTTIKDTSKIVQEQDRKKPTGPYQAIKLHTVVYSSIQTIQGHTHNTYNKTLHDHIGLCGSLPNKSLWECSRHICLNRPFKNQ